MWRFSLRARADRDRAPAGERSSCRPSSRRCAELPALALAVTVDELTATVARYLGEERTAASFESFAASRAHQPRSRQRGRHPSAALRRAPARLGDRRGLLAARALAAAAQAHGLDQGGAQAARRRQRGDPVQPRHPADRARPCAARASRCSTRTCSCLLEPAVRRDPRPAAGARPASASGSTRSCASTPSSGALGPGARRRSRARRASRATSRAREPFRERFAERGLVIEVRANPMPDGGIVTTSTDMTPSVEAAEALDAPTRRSNGACEERTEELTRAQCRARARQGRGRGSQHLEDALPRRREPRHPAAAQCGAALRHQPGRAAGQRRGRAAGRRTSTPRSKRSRRSSARCSTSRGSMPARMKPEISQLPHRRADAPARGRVRAARAREGPRARLRAVLAARCAPTGGCCAGCCRTSSPTRSNTRRRAACWSAAGARDGRLRIEVYDTGLGIPQSKQRDDLPRIPPARSGRQGRARARASASRSSSASRACSTTGRVATRSPAAARISRVEVPLAPALPQRRRDARAAARRRRASSPACWCCASTTSRRSSTAWRRCSAAGAAACSRRRT